MSIADYDDGYKAGLAAAEKDAEQHDRYDEGYSDGERDGYESGSFDSCANCEYVDSDAANPRLCGNCQFLHPERLVCYWYPHCDIHGSCEHWEAFVDKVHDNTNRNYWPVWS